MDQIKGKSVSSLKNKNFQIRKKMLGHLVKLRSNADLTNCSVKKVFL